MKSEEKMHDEWEFLLEEYFLPSNFVQQRNGVIGK